MEKERLTSRGLTLRSNILELAVASNEGHVPSSFSIVEMLLAITDHQVEIQGEFSFDRIVLSKGHATYAWYALLREFGYFSDEEFNSVGKMGSKFYGHLPFIHGDTRFAFGSGSLGHGLPFSIGRAIGSQLYGDDRPIYVIVGDGEANEGTFWESILLLGKDWGVSQLNLKVLIDSNGSSERAIPVKSYLHRLVNLVDFDCLVVDGHDIGSVSAALGQSKQRTLILVCNTEKGFPIRELAEPAWHHKSIDVRLLNELSVYMNSQL
jgi:transketolase